MRRGVIDDLRTIVGKHLEHPSAVADGTDQGDKVQVRIRVLQLILDIIGVVLIDVKDDQLPRMMRRNLTTEFGTNRPAAAGYEDDLTFDVCGNLIDVVVDLLSAEKVFDTDFAELSDGDFPIHKLIDCRKGLDFGARFLADVDDVTSVFGLGARKSNVDLIDAILLDKFRDVFIAFSSTGKSKDSM